MWRQRLNRPNRNRRVSRRQSGLNGAASPKPICDAQTGFIHHAPGFPLDYRRVWFDSRYNHDEAPGQGEIGLIFESDKYIRPGTVLEVMIPLRKEETKFRGKVVLVRNYNSFFEIGLWMQNAEDASRVRIVEQICHIETYLKQRKYRDGPYNLNRDRIASEWIMENAGTVPRL